MAASPTLERTMRSMVAAAAARSGDGGFREATSPGPVYLPRYDAVSTFKAQASVVFPAAPRHPSSKNADSTPGPGAYPLPTTVGATRTVGIRGREKFGSAADPTTGDVPGPGEYVRLDTRHTAKRNAPVYSMKGKHAPLLPTTEVPAPNEHQPVESMVKPQFVAKLTNAPRVKFGPPPRSRVLTEDAAAVFASPGPGEYTTDPAFSTLSTIPSAPAYSIVPRRPHVTKSALRISPEFHTPVAGIGKQVLSSKKTAPAPTFSGRVKFGSPYA